MIYTVTLNPALDRTIWIDTFKFDDTCRITSEKRFPGGKGVDVSRMIKTLGGESIALGFIGGFDGFEFQGRLLNEGIPHDFIRIAGETRTNIIIHAANSPHELKVNAAGPEIKPEELGIFIDKIKSLEPKPTNAVISGSIPPGLSKGIYREMTLAFESLGAKVILDADGESLEKGLPATPFMIKPNVHELRRLIGRDFESTIDMIGCARSLLQDELEVVVVSAGAKGVYVVLEDGGFHATTPDVPVKNSVGAGDSLIGGIVFELDRGGSLEDAIRLGVACGTATAMSEGSAQGTKEDVEKILPLVGIQKLPE
jgi:6-phosphofructokinase 2